MPAHPLALALIVTLHVLVLVFWPKAPPEEAHRPATGAIAIRFVPIPKTASEPAPTPALTRAQGIRQPRKAAVPAPAMTIVAPAITLLIPPPPLETPADVPPVASGDDILKQARRDVGKIDRALRKESLDMAVRNMKLTAPKIERVLGGAYAGGGNGMQIEELVMADGRRMSRIGNVCVYKESNGLVGGRDVFRDGVKTKVASCPR